MDWETILDDDAPDDAVADGVEPAQELRLAILQHKGAGDRLSGRTSTFRLVGPYPAAGRNGYHGAVLQLQVFQAAKADLTDKPQEVTL